jgi:hypothetical protein
MKINKQYLKQVIKEELEKTLNEQQTVNSIDIETMKKLSISTNVDVIEQLQKNVEAAFQSLKNATINLNQTLKQDFASKKYNSGNINELRNLFNNTYKNIVSFDEKNKKTVNPELMSAYNNLSTAYGKNQNLYSELYNLMKLYIGSEIPRIENLFTSAFNYASKQPAQQPAAQQTAK